MVIHAGWLYIHVALNTVDAPIINDDVILKSNRATELRSHRTIDREVANPFRMLSEYVTTIAVTRPPITWIAMVAQAHALKWRNKSRKKPRESGGGCVEDREKSGYQGEKRGRKVSGGVLMRKDDGSDGGGLVIRRENGRARL